MVFSKVLVAALAASGAVAQSSSCSSSSPLTIQNSGDASALSSCTTYDGSITVASNTADKLEISGVRQITGDLIIDGATNLTSVSADSLQKIGGKFTVNNLQNLNQLQMPYLTQVNDISFQGLPNLGQLSFDRNIQQVRTLNIQNTFLSTLQGINLQNVNSIYVANNRMLQSLSFQVTRVPENIIILGNGDQFEAKFPNLETAQNITLRTCKSISIPSLKNVTGNFGILENKITSIEANNLTGVGQTLAINANPSLTNVSMPMLKIIGGGFQVQNNTILKEVSFPKVEAIGGAFDFYGDFDKVELPALKDCRGGFNLQSSGDVDCSPFDSQHGSNKVIKGTYKCYNKVSNPGNAKSDPKDGSGKKAAGSFVAANSALLSLAGGMAAVMALM